MGFKPASGVRSSSGEDIMYLSAIVAGNDERTSYEEVVFVK
jgi:hypothetical protein